MTMTEPDQPDYRSLLASTLEQISAHARVGTGEAPLGTPTSLQADVAEPPPVEELDELDDTIDPDEPVPAGGDYGSVDTQSRRASRYEWGGHQNGRIPDDALKLIGQGGHRLEASAADAWMAMREAAAADGITLSLTDSYRTYDAQVRLREDKGDQVATATPGTSVHGWGRAVDANVNDRRVLDWMRANGARFGWVNPEWAQREGKSYEPWHWEFQGGTDG